MRKTNDILLGLLIALIIVVVSITIVNHNSNSNITSVYENLEIGKKLETVSESGYTKICEANLLSDKCSTEILVRYNGILYGKSYSGVTCGNKSGEMIGKIDKLTGKEYVPQLDSETNTEEILNASIDFVDDEILILICNNKLVLFKKIDENR